MTAFPISKIINFFTLSLCSVWIGEKAVRECIAQGRKFADASQGSNKGRIRKVCDDLDRLMGDLAELRRQGNVSKHYENVLAS